MSGGSKIICVQQYVAAYNAKINQKLVLNKFLVITSCVKGSSIMIFWKLATYLVVDLLYQERYNENGLPFQTRTKH